MLAVLLHSWLAAFPPLSQASAPGAVATAMPDAVSVAETGLVFAPAAPPRMPCNVW